MSGIERYFGEKVSLLSTSDVRYDGELYTADPSEQSIALKHVNCMGTEGRRSGDQVIAPSDCTYEFIIFRAVNISDLWLEKSGGQRVTLNKEVLEPLRAGQSSAAKDKTDESKRKVGYQGRGNQGGRGRGRGQDNYYRQPRRDHYGRGGYGPPRGDYDGYPPPNYRGYPQQYGQYDGYYRDYRQGGGRQSYYQQGGRRQPQYYNNQQRQHRGYGGYYNQGYRQDDRYYNGRAYRNQGYDQGYNQRGGYRAQREDRPTGKAGTGAFLDSRRLRGDEIDVKDQQEFDFESALKDFGPKPADEDMGALAVAMDSMALEAQQQQANGGKAENADEDNGKKDEEDTKVSGDNKYDKNKSFFDGLDTETKKSKPRADMQTQKDVDTSTFGSVAATYKSRHITRNKRPGGGGRNNYYQGQGGGQRRNGGGGYDQRGYGAQRGYDQRGGQRRDYQSYNRQQDRANGGYRNNRDNRWVQKN